MQNPAGIPLTTEGEDLWLRYARWWYVTHQASEEFLDWMHEMEENPGFSAEDLGDFVESLHSILTFGPNPRSLTPPILPEDLT